MNRARARVFLAIGVALFGMALGDGAASAAPERPAVITLHLDGVVDPFTASYVKDGIDQANQDGAPAVLITIDTPGGLDSSMRTIIKSILNSRVPVVCDTAPSGARAASAGTFIMMACPVSAMAPGTNIGAAHPVGVSGAIEESKVTNDAAAFIRSLAERWNRNPDWAERAVRNSVSLSAEEALRMKVIDLIEPSTSALFRAVGGGCGSSAPGPNVSTGLLAGGSVPAVCGAPFETLHMGLGVGILHALIDPNLAFLFFFVGLVLIVIELLHPGISVPGIVGTLMLVSSFVSFGFLPVQLGGVILLVVSAVFFLLELKHPGFGLPTVGGVVTLVMGGLLLFNPAVPNARVSIWLLVVLAALLTLFFGFVVKAVLDARHLPTPSGYQDMVGETGTALTDLSPSGQVRARRETWSAVTEGPAIAAGSPVRVVRIDGLRVVVEPDGTASPAASREAATGKRTEMAGRPAAPKGGGS